MTCRRRLEELLFAAMAMASAIAMAAEDPITAAAFSALRAGAAMPAEWRPLTASSAIPATRYTLVDDGGSTVVHAEARAAASGLSKSLRVNPLEFPWLRWRWKIDNLIASADLRSKEGDDFPARLYVMFDYPLEKLPLIERTKLRLARALFDAELPAATLCYVWDNRTPTETIVPSAYSARVQLIVVASGAARVGQWTGFERNVAADFRAAFGDEAPPVKAIAIATDTDNTGSFATAYFGDIFFYKHMLTKTPPGSGSAR